MFHHISGILYTLTGDKAVIECGGIGFSIGISSTTASRLGHSIGKSILLYTYMAVSEDSISLYGFLSEEELLLFTKLLAVSGIGPKAAVSLLGTLSADALRAAVANGDAKTISTAPGIGLKTAQKIIIELKGRIGGNGTDITPPPGADGEKLSQVADTLAVYGHPRAKVMETLKKLDTSLPLEQLIYETLRAIGKESE